MTDPWDWEDNTDGETSSETSGSPCRSVCARFHLNTFLRVEPFNEERLWQEYIDDGTDQSSDRLAILLKNLLLIRTKLQKCAVTNAPIIELKSKHVTVHELTLQDVESKAYEVMYKATQAKAKELLLDEEGKRTVKNPFIVTSGEDENSTQYSSILIMLLRLRQACVHMNLTRHAVDLNAFDHLDAAAEDSYGDDTSQIFEKTFLSSKIKKLLEIVKDCKRKREKVVVVSQWTSLLEIVEGVLREKRTRFTRICGKVAPKDRQTRVESFNKEGGGAQVMLLSLAAGGVGLNLVGGNHLVMMDLHWNPALEAQASDRIYRMGQKRPVHIHRLVTVNTIEERVVVIQARKTELAQSVLDGGATDVKQLTKGDLEFLFGLGPQRGTGNALTD